MLSVDKGIKTVVIDKAYYYEKAEQLLNVTVTYRVQEMQKINRRTVINGTWWFYYCSFLGTAKNTWDQSFNGRQFWRTTGSQDCGELWNTVNNAQ